jgi:Transposase DDE domain
MCRADDKSRNVYICPAFKTLTTTGKIVDNDQILYRASKPDCDACPYKMRCCPKEPARKIPRNVHEDARDVARALAGTDAFEQSCRDRKRVEMAVCSSQAHPQARSPPAARPARCARRVHARCDRSEPTPSRQVRRPTAAATTHGVRCVSGVCVSADASTPKLLASASANQRPSNGLAGRLRPAVRLLLQRNRHSSPFGRSVHGTVPAPFLTRRGSRWTVAGALTMLPAASWRLHHPPPPSEAARTAMRRYGWA